MNVRLLTSGAMLALTSYACSQSTTPMPVEPSQTESSQIRGTEPLRQPALKLFNTPSAGSWPEYIVAGPQQAMWFAEFDTDRVGRVTMGGKMTEFSLPYGNDIEGITIGSDGNIWFTEPGADKIGRMTPKGIVTTFPINSANPSPRGITRGSDGNVWYVEYYDGYIGRVTPQGAITRFPIPEGSNSSPWAITTGPDGNLWFTESITNKIGRFNPTTQQYEASLTVPTPNGTPWGILNAPDKHIWFTERTGDKIAEVTNQGTIKEFSIAQGTSYPETIAPGGDGNLWFTEMNAGIVASINPKTGKFGSTVTLPSGGIPIGIAQGFNKNVWFCISSYHNPMQIGEPSFRIRQRPTARSRLNERFFISFNRTIGARWNT